MDVNSWTHRHGSEDTLGDVYRHLSAKGSLTRTFGPLKCYITGSEALVPHPFRFWYYSCTQTVGNGRLCGKTAQNCEHSSKGVGKKKTFRFDVFFSDGCLSESMPPLRAGIFEDASTFLQVTADTLSNMSELDQHLYVAEKMAKQHWVQTILRCKDGLVTVYDIKLVENNPICLTPTLSKANSSQVRCEGGLEGTRGEGQEGDRISVTSPSTFVTPRSDFRSSRLVPEGSSSSTLPRHGRYEDVRAKLVDLITVIDLTQDD